MTDKHHEDIKILIDSNNYYEKDTMEKEKIIDMLTNDLDKLKNQFKKTYETLINDSDLSKEDKIRICQQEIKRLENDEKLLLMSEANKHKQEKAKLNDEIKRLNFEIKKLKDDIEDGKK